MVFLVACLWLATRRRLKPASSRRKDVESIGNAGIGKAHTDLSTSHRSTSPYAEVLNPVWDVCSARLDKTLFKLLSNSLLWVYLAKLHMYLSPALQIAAWKVMIINRRTIIFQLKGHESFPVAKSIFVSNVFMVVRQYCRGSCITIYPAKPFLHWRLLYATEMPIYGSGILFNSNSLYSPKITYSPS